MARAVLVGLPGVGKTTLARALAARWSVDVRDTDEMIAVKVGVSAPQYLRTFGEAAFRDREIEALVEALGGDVVVACGGGVVTTPRGRDELRRQNTVWLDCSDDVIVERLRDGDRPLLGDDFTADVARLRAERVHWYEEVAKVRLDASGTPDEAVERLVVALAEAST